MLWVQHPPLILTGSIGPGSTLPTGTVYSGPGLLLLSSAWEWDGDKAGLAALPKTTEGFPQDRSAQKGNRKQPTWRWRTQTIYLQTEDLSGQS